MRVRDVAQVKVGAAVRRGAAGYNGQPAVLLSITKQPGAGTVSTTQRVDRGLDELEQSVARSGARLERNIFRQQDFIDMAIENLLRVLRDGAVLVVCVLFLFLWSLRPTLISLMAIPLSLLIAMLVLDLVGLSVDTMTLGGLAIAIGELVDDAIVDVENVLRRLGERMGLPESERPAIVETVRTASLEIRPAIVAATAILMLVFVPLLLLDGIEGRLLRPLSIAYLAAIFASLIVAMTVTPVLCSLVLPSLVKRRQRGEAPLLRVLGGFYERVLEPTLARPSLVIAGVGLLLLAGLFGLSRAGRSFLPQFNEGSLTINMVLQPGTALGDSDTLARLAESTLLADRGVLSVGRRTGRAERDEHVLGVETSELEVRVNPDDGRTREQLFEDIRERLRAIPGGRFTLGQPISHRIEHMLSGHRAALSIKVVGDDLRELRRVAREVEALAQRVPGLVDVNVEQSVDIPQLLARVDVGAAADYGLSAGEATRAVGTALWGRRVSQIYEDGTATDVVVKVSPEVLDSSQALRALRIPTPSGALVPLYALAELRRDSGPNYILREHVRRRVVVSANF